MYLFTTPCKNVSVAYSGSVCKASGDPHFSTFDGALIHFQGSCSYALVRVNEGRRVNVLIIEVLSNVFFMFSFIMCQTFPSFP